MEKERKGWGFVPFLLIHLLKSVGDVERTDFFVVLKFEEFVAAVASHVNEDIRPIV